MTTDAIALCRQNPDLEAVLQGLLATVPNLRLRLVEQGALLQLLDDDGRPVFAVEGPRLIQVPGEAARLLGAEAGRVEAPLWWVEARAPDANPEGARLARALIEDLVARLGGAVWTSDR